MGGEARGWRLLYLAAGGGSLQEVADAIADWMGAPACITWPSAFTGIQVYASSYASPSWVLARGADDEWVVRYPLTGRDPRGPHALRPQLTVFGRPRLAPAEDRLFRRLLAALGSRWRHQLDDVEAEVARAFDRVGQAIAGRPADRWPELFSPLLQVAAQLFLAPVAYVAVPTDDGQAIAVVDKIGVQDPDFGFVLPLGRGVGGHVAARGRGLVVRDYRTTSLRDRSVSALIDREDLKSGVIVPWTTPEGTRGALYVAWRESGRPTPWAIFALSAFARRIGPWVWPHRPKRRYQRAGSLSSAVGDRVGRLRSVLATATALGQVAAAFRAAGVGLEVTDSWGAPLLETKGSGPSEELSIMAPGLSRPYAVKLHWPEDWLLHRETVRADLGPVLPALIAADENRRAAELRRPGRPNPTATSPAFLLGIALRDPGDVQLALLLTRRLARAGLAVTPHWVGDGILYAALPAPAFSFPARIREWVCSLPEPVLVAATMEPVPPARQEVALSRMRAALSAGGRGIRWIGRPALDAWLDWSTARDVFGAFAREWIPKDSSCRSEWLETAYHYLLTGDISETARRLYLHPNTVRYRLQQLRAHLEQGWDTDEGRVALLLALAVWRSTGHDP